MHSAATLCQEVQLCPFLGLSLPLGASDKESLACGPQGRRLTGRKQRSLSGHGGRRIHPAAARRGCSSRLGHSSRTGPVRAFLANTRLTALRDTGSGKRLPELRQIVSRDRKLDLAAAVLSSNYYPAPINKPRRRLTERNGRLTSREHIIPQRLGRRDHKCIRTDGQPFWATQGNPHTAGASESATAEDPDTGEGSFKAHPRPYLGTQRTVTRALTVSPYIGSHNHAENCSCKDELHNHAHELAFMKDFTLAVANRRPGPVPELQTGPDDHVRVDHQARGDVLDRRQPVTLPQLAQQKRLPHLVHGLRTCAVCAVRRSGLLANDDSFQEVTAAG